MSYVRAAVRKLPDGTESFVFPFHVSLEGLEKCVICRDDEDCDAMVKTLCVCARRKNVIIIIYAVASNHAHAAVLAKKKENAMTFGQEVKRNYSLKFKNRYGENKVLRGTSVDVRIIQDMRYLRNVLTYIPKNAFDNGASNLNDYKWTGFRAMFNIKKQGLLKVSDLTRREKESIMHTGDNLAGVPWMLNGENELEPWSFCDSKYLEEAFNNDQAFFFRLLGTVSTAEMIQKTQVAPREMKTDADFCKDMEELAKEWFGKGIRDMGSEKKARLLQYAYRTAKTTIPQLSRTFGIARETVSLLLGKPVCD
jgi:REP element-mobilizing transposase RayT